MAEQINPICHREWNNGIDADTLVTGTIYCGNDCTNVPDKYCMIFTMGSGERAQIAISRDTGKVYVRVVIPGSWREL